jgi:hypothetical protein
VVLDRRSGKAPGAGGGEPRGAERRRLAVDQALRQRGLAIVIGSR